MAKAVEEYLALRCALGFELRGSAGMLRSFAHYLEQQRASHVSTELALRWAKQPTEAQPVWWANRLGVVRRFAQYLSASDPRTEIPPMGLLPFRYRRKSPYLYSDAEVRALVSAASRIASPTGLRAATYSTLIGLLAVSGLRISEAIGLDDRDVDLAGGVLTIRRTKFGKSRLVLLHRSTNPLQPSASPISMHHSSAHSSIISSATAATGRAPAMRVWLRFTPSFAIWCSRNPCTRRSFSASWRCQPSATSEGRSISSRARRCKRCLPHPSAAPGSDVVTMPYSFSRCKQVCGSPN